MSDESALARGPAMRGGAAAERAGPLADGSARIASPAEDRALQRPLQHTVGAISAVAYRDLLKFVRDRSRILTSLLFPFVFVVFFGGSLQAGIGDAVGLNYLVFTFTGVIALTLFQSSTMGIVSLIDDRENDFSQEIFVAPISRHAIIFGKISGETLVSLAQAVGIVVLGVVIGVAISPLQLPLLVAAALLVCIAGGAFGLVVLTNLSSRRAAEQVFPLILLPQYFLAGVFTPVTDLPPALSLLSHLMPMRYAVDLIRAVFYGTSPTYESDAGAATAGSWWMSAAVLAAIFAVCLVVGTTLFTRRERNR